MNLLEFVLVLLLGMLIGHLIAIYQFQKAIRQLTENLGLNLDTELINLHNKLNESLKEIFTLETEQIEGTFYLYDRESKDFICQGKTIDELAELAKRYKNIEYASVLHEGIVYTFMDGKAKEFHDENKN